jgi:hypothetical protein
MTRSRGITLVAWFLGFGLAMGYWAESYADASTLRWSVAWIGLLILSWLIKPESIVLPKLWYLLLLLMGISISWSTSWPDAIWQLQQFVLLGGMFWLGMQDERISENVFIGASWGIGINSLIAIGQLIDPSLFDFGEVSRPAGLMGNRDFLAEMAALTVIWSFGERRWKLTLIQLPSLILPQARAALVAFGLTSVLLLWLNRNRRLAVGLLLGAAGLLVFFSLTKSAWNDQVRWSIWSHTWEGVNWVGHGVGQFYSTYLNHPFELLGNSRPDHAHNDWLEVLYELGPIGLAITLFLVAQIVLGGRESCRLVFLCFCILCLGSFALHNPQSAVLAFVSGGRAWRDGALLWIGATRSTRVDIQSEALGRFDFGSKVASILFSRLAIRPAHEKGLNRVAMVKSNSNR